MLVASLEKEDLNNSQTVGYPKNEKKKCVAIRQKPPPEALSLELSRC